MGTATAGCPSNISPPHKVVALFGGKLDQVDEQSKSAAKLAVHLLKQPHSSSSKEADMAAGLSRMLSIGFGPSGAGSGVTVQGVLNSRGSVDPPDSQTLSSEGTFEAGDLSEAAAANADALDRLVQLLEQYCHPSNTGSWSGDLAVFLRYGVHYFMKVRAGRDTMVASCVPSGFSFCQVSEPFWWRVPGSVHDCCGGALRP